MEKVSLQALPAVRAAGAAHLYRRRAESVLHRQRVRVQLYRQRAAPVPAGGRFAHEPWISVLLNGAWIARFPVAAAKARSALFRGLTPGVARHVRVLKDVQAMPDEPDHFLQITALGVRDGEFLPLPAPAYRLEFIGDSITSGEGANRRQTGGGLGQRLFQRGAPLCPPDGRGAGRGMAHHQPERLGAAVWLGQRPPPLRDGLLRAGLRRGGRRAQRRAGRAAAV